MNKKHIAIKILSGALSASLLAPYATAFGVAGDNANNVKVSEQNNKKVKNQKNKYSKAALRIAKNPYAQAIGVTAIVGGGLYLLKDRIFGGSKIRKTPQELFK